jgi:CrcB protein
MRPSAQVATAWSPSGLNQMLGLPEVTRRELAAIFAGGALGALARGGISQLFPSGPTSWPWAVFVVNVTGAFILGYFVTELQGRNPPSIYRLRLIGTGFCGAFTTFSTMQLELLNMVRDHEYGLAAGYAVASVALGYVALSVASRVAGRIGDTR